MREIKFRAWEDGIMANPFTLIDAITTDADLTVDDIQSVIYMQYTGLKDKNGKEIYEGDITSIQAEDGKINKFIVRFGIAQRIMQTGWLVDIPSFYFDLIGGDFKAFPIVINYKGKHDLEMMKIIGNIYENPEILERAAHG
uniref:Putative YopX protein n=1 Tax=viral metagenome TaxID=1070528 RepID=A0A6M3XJK2_9ZZZZ